MGAVLFIGRCSATRAPYGLIRVYPEFTMTTTHTFPLFSFAPSRALGASSSATGTVAAGAAATLVPKAAMVLRVAEGQAWVTLGNGERDDLILCAGQSVPVAAGQSVVVEPLGGRRLQYRWVDGDAAGARPASWWRRASVGNGAPAWGDACCA